MKTPSKVELDYTQDIKYINRIDKNLLKKWFEDNIFASSKNVNLNMILGYKKDEKEYSFLDIYDKE